MGTTIPGNRAFFSVEDILSATGGSVLRPGASSATGVSTDTRRMQPGNVFVALRGERFDGHDHVMAACDAGASVLVVSRPVEASNGATVVMVEDTLRALGALARTHKRRWVRRGRTAGRLARVVAVTGSAGKTTTCRAIRAVLEQAKPNAVHAAVGNLNNAVGVPLVLLGLDDGHELAVVELGTSSPGEIAYGVSIVEPDVSVLTLVSCAHAQGLGSVEGVAAEKGAVYGSLGTEGVAIVNGDDGRAREQWAMCAAGRKLAYGRGDGSDVRITSQRLEGVDTQQLGYEVKRAGGSWTLQASVPLLGDAGAYACAAAIAVRLGVFDEGFDVDGVRRALESIQGEERRLRPRRLGSGTLLIDDAYNANPASMADSVRTAAAIGRQFGRRLVLVLGEMRELGSYAEAEHRALGRAAYESGASLLIAVAGEAARVAQTARELGLESQFAADSREAAQLVVRAVGPDDIVLVKGSRGVALERVVEALDEQGGSSQ